MDSVKNNTRALSKELNNFINLSDKKFTKNEQILRGKANTKAIEEV